ncbi:MAG: ferritin-like fold-containing protein [Proteobacteria bacterium]|nr:ferritin-like fold-containing protein [Pseudomonadota bacterium]
MAEDVHSLPQDEFRERVQSFEFWFGAVQGYLEGREYGHRPDAPAAEIALGERERLVSTLCNYCVGETAALEGAGALIRLAPNQATKVFLATQTVDEGRHLEVLIHRLRELGVRDPEAEIPRWANPSLLRFKDRLLSLVEAGEWLPALFAQNVVLEAMEFAGFQRHARQADATTREVLIGIVKDERRHIGFGENELGRELRRNPKLRERLQPLRAELDVLVLDALSHTLRQLGAPASERHELGRDYRDAVERLGFT